LRPVKDSKRKEVSALSRFEFSVGAIEPDEGSGVFTLMLHCSSSLCAEAVAVSGTFRYGSYTPDDSPDPVAAAFLKPCHFSPTIHIFPICEKCPERVRKAILIPFDLYWNSPQGAGNALRTAVEALLDYLGVRKWTKNKKGELITINLGARIVEYSKKSPAVGEILMAIKWIGNSGSHLSNLTHESVIAGYQLFSHALDEIFEKRTATITKMAKKINKRKKPTK